MIQRREAFNAFAATLVVAVVALWVLFVTGCNSRVEQLPPTLRVTGYGESGAIQTVKFKTDILP